MFEHLWECLIMLDTAWCSVFQFFVLCQYTDKGYTQVITLHYRQKLQNRRWQFFHYLLFSFLFNWNVLKTLFAIFFVNIMSNHNLTQMVTLFESPPKNLQKKIQIEKTLQNR